MNKLPSVYSYEKLARALGENVGLRVSFEEDVFPHADSNGVLHVPPPNINWDKDQYTVWLGTIYHEIGHVVPEQWEYFDLLKQEKISMDSFYGMVFNMVTDYDNEHYDLGFYEGRDSTLSQSHGFHLNGIVENIKTNGTENMQENMCAAIGALAIENKFREDWQPDVRGIGMADFLPPEIKKYYDRLTPHEEELKKAFNNLNASPQDAKSLTEKLLKYLGFDPEEEKQKSQEQYKNSKDGGGEEDKKSGKKQAEGKGQESNGDEGKGNKTRDQEATIKWKDLMKHQHDPDRDTTTWQPMTITYDVDDLYKKAPWQWQDVDVVNYPKKIKSAECHSQVFTPTHYTQYFKNLPPSSAFANKIRRLLQIETRNRYYYGKKKGHLHNKNLYRLSMKDAGDFNKRIFKHKDVNTDLDVSVTILTDNSGSMGGDKFINATHSAVMLHEVLHAINVPHELLSFSHIGRGTLISILKGFNDKTSREKLLHNYSCVANSMGGNDDATAVMFAYDRLLKQPTKRKLLIVLSDGQPAAGGLEYSAPGALKEITSRIEGDKLVELYAIGIDSRSVSNFYSKYSVISDSSELENKLLSVLKNKIIREEN